MLSARFLFRLGFAALAFLAAGLRLPAAESLPDGTAPLPGETVFLEKLEGVITVPDAAAVAAPSPAGFTGVDTARTPLLADPAVADLIGRFLDKPMSFGSLDRLCIAVRTWLRLRGEPFVLVHAPPQEIAGGVMRLVVRRARLDGELRVEGAKYFREESYRTALLLAPGGEIDAVSLQAAVDRLNRSGYRRVTLAAEPGAEPGSTRLTARAQEVRPWRFTTGYDNYGTAITDENRVSFGAAWGNAFGRGDTLGYNLNADPAFAHSVNHAANYGTVFRWGHSLSLFGAYSSLESVLPEPLTQHGTSWQAGARYEMPLAKPAGGWEKRVGFAADFKYSDNNLEFAAIPVTNNVTHLAQFGATFSLSRQGERQRTALTAAVFASPGGLTAENDDEAFNASRPGARAAYVYGRVDGQWVCGLPREFSFSLGASVQLASGPLLGSEQLNGGGSAGVRGYPESSAFGDEGALANVELHLPGFAPFRQHGEVDLFTFVDGAMLVDRGPDGETTHLASLGIGLNYRIAGHFSLSAAYGWQLNKLSAVAGGSSRGHISATLQF